MPDFMSAERTFQLITQVSGRAGRGDIPGNVVVQTLASDHYALQSAARHDFEGFYEQEIVFREEAGYPPFSRLASVVVSAVSNDQALCTADDVAAHLRESKKSLQARVEILGPAPAPLSRLRGRCRIQILLKAMERRDLHRLLTRLQMNYTPPTGVRMLIDVDPVEML
jgi:primosomal protein N' (replication factor Y)